MEEIKKILGAIQADMASQKFEIREIQKNITTDINKNINEKFEKFEIKTEKLEKTLENQEKIIDNIERQLRKRNLVLFGVEEEKKGSYFGLVDIVLKIINKTMENKCGKQEIESVRRIGKIGERARPIIISFTTMGRKIELLKNKKALDPYYVTEDYPPKVLEKRKQLKEELNKEIEQGKNAVLIYDKIVILKNKKGLQQNNKRPLSESPENAAKSKCTKRQQSSDGKKKNKTIQSFMVTLKEKESSP